MNEKPSHRHIRALCPVERKNMNFTLNYDKTQLLAAIDHVVDKTLEMDLTWEWPCGVGFYGVCKAYEATGKKEYIDRLAKWTDEYIALGIPPFTVNTCAMGHTMMTLYEVTGDEKYWKIALDKLDYLRHKALRFGKNVLQHTVSVNNDFPEQAWADTLFMAAYFMLRMGKKLGDEEIIADALNQYYWHIHYLQNKSAGLFYHGYNNLTKDNMSGFFWARANAWAAYTMAQAKHTVNYLYPLFMEIDSSLRDQLAGIKKLQTENGLWRTILDDANAYEEISASAGIGAAMILNDNILHTKYIQKALDGVLKNISADGRVLNVSAGTAVMKTREDYRQVPKAWGQGWGQGLALAFLSAVLKYCAPAETFAENEA